MLNYCALRIWDESKINPYSIYAPFGLVKKWENMGFPKVKSLLCLNLQTGTFLIACLSLVGNMGCFLFFLYTLVIDLRVMEVTFGNTLTLVVD